MTDGLRIGGRLLVVFDGRCGFCNRAVRWFLRRDRGDRLRFVASESEKVAALLKRHGIETEVSGAGPGTILVVEDADGPGEKLLDRSDAVVAMLRELPGPWPAVGCGAEVGSEAGSRSGLPAHCALAVPDMGAAGELPFAYGRGAGAVSAILGCASASVSGSGGRPKVRKD